MFFNYTTVGPLFVPWKRQVVVRHATAVAVNDVMALDSTLASSSTTSGYSASESGGGTLGAATGSSAISGYYQGNWILKPDLGYTGIITPLGESDTAGQHYCVVTSLLGGTGADGTLVEVTLLGRCVVKVASATLTPGQLLMMSTTEANRELIAAATGTGSRPLAVVEIGGSSVTTATVNFFGGLGGVLAHID